jgi:hypothetical protein
VRFEESSNPVKAASAAPYTCTDGGSSIAGSCSSSLETPQAVNMLTASSSDNIANLNIRVNIAIVLREQEDYRTQIKLLINSIDTNIPL